MSDIKDKKKIVIEYDYDNVCTILEYSKFLKKHLSAGNKIPARVLKKYISLFAIETERLRLKEEVKSKADVVKQKTLERYSKDKGFAFNKKLMDTDQFFEGEKSKSICSLENMLNSIFDKIEDGLLENDKKTHIITLTYLAINDYFDSFQGNTLKILSYYRRAAISGYIALKFGVTLSKEIEELQGREPTNELLFQSAKHYANKKDAK